MVALALTLQLLGAPAAAAPALHLVPPLALSLEVPGAPAPPELAPPLPRAGPSPWARAGQHALSSGGLLLGDGIAASVFILGYIVLVGDLLRGDTSGDDAEALLLVGGVTWLFLPPALGVGGARLGGAPRERGAAAYWAAFLLHLGTTIAVAAAADRGHGGLAGAAFVAGELVVTPYVILRILDGGAPAAAEPGLPSPAARALPPR